MNYLDHEMRTEMPMVDGEGVLQELPLKYEEKKKEEDDPYPESLSLTVVNHVGAIPGRSNTHLPYRYRVTADDRARRRCRCFFGSIRLAFLSHACFFLGSVFYVRSSHIDLRSYLATREVPDDVIDDLEKRYTIHSSVYSTLGAFSFILVGVFDWLRCGSCTDGFMILAGLAGVAAGATSVINKATSTLWDCISVHLYLLEAFNLLHREDEHELVGAERWFRSSDVCFLLGSILDVGVCYADLSVTRAGLGIASTGMLAAWLWLACSLIDVTEEIYFLQK